MIKVIFQVIYMLMLTGLVISCKSKLSSCGPDLSIQFKGAKPAVINIRSLQNFDTVKIKYEYWDYLLMDHKTQEITVYHFLDTVLEINIFKPELINFTINHTTTTVFCYPGQESNIKLSTDHNQFTITPDQDGSISNYLSLAGPSTFGTPEGDWSEIENIVSNEKERKQRILDSLKFALPEWFYKRENNTLHLLYYNMLLSAFSYRTELLGYQEKLPQDLENFLDTIKLFDQENFTDPHYVQIIYSKLVNAETKTGKVIGKGSPSERYNKILQLINEMKDEKRFINRDQMQNFILHSLSSMQLSSRKFPDSLQQEYFNSLDSVRQKVATEQILKRTDLTNKPALNFTLKYSDGSFAKLSDFRGKPIWISFWFTGCKPCIKEFPAENLLVEKYKDTDIQFISVCTNSDEEHWKTMLREHQLQTKNLYANSNWSEIIADRYQIKSYPKWTLIGRDGKVIQEKLPAPSDPEISKWLEEFINQ